MNINDKPLKECSEQSINIKNYNSISINRCS